MPNSIITRSGCYIPMRNIENKFFLNNEFYNSNRERLTKPNKEIVTTLQEITCIKERRWANDDLVTSDIAYLAAREALNGEDGEDLEFIIVAHNYGDVKAGTVRVDICPSLAARVKHMLGIKNPYAVAYDVPFGCPGWVHGMTIADYYIKSGEVKKILVIDDEVPTLEMLRLFLGACGYQVFTASSEPEGLEIFEKETPPIVLTDIKMPGKDGFAILKSIKELRPETEVIVITGHGDKDLAKKALELEASDFFNKPLDTEALEQALKRIEERLKHQE